jgi:hypothetical protein
MHLKINIHKRLNVFMLDLEALFSREMKNVQRFIL